MPYYGISIGGAFPVTTTSQVVLLANEARKTAVFVNDSAEVIYLSFGHVATLNSAIRLNPAGGAYELFFLERFNRCVWTGEVHAIHGGAGNQNLCIQEFR